jgi:hypothetical protein
VAVTRLSYVAKISVYNSQDIIGKIDFISQILPIIINLEHDLLGNTYAWTVREPVNHSALIARCRAVNG